MKGRNHIILNDVSMKEAIEYYLKNIFLSSEAKSIKVINIAKASDGFSICFDGELENEQP